MNRIFKNILCIAIILVICYSMVITSLSAANNPVKSLATINTKYDIQNQKDTEVKYIYHESAPFIIYIVVESFLFALCACYLIFTKFCKNVLGDLFKENSAMIISYLISSLCMSFMIGFFTCYFVQYMIIK